MSALYFMVFVAGIEIGGNRHIIKKICNPQSILLAVAIPTAVTIGSLGGAALSAFVTGMEMRDALLVGSALGWYSLSSVVISTLYSVEIGTIAFLANMLREVLAFLAIPLLVKINKFLALAPSGAATMDSGLPVVIKYTNINVGLFVIIRLASVILMLFNLGGFPFLQYLQVPSSPELLLYRPWTIITYMFTHFDFLHILFNMLWLYWFGGLFLTFFQ